jgi:hypothetical protein
MARVNPFGTVDPEPIKKPDPVTTAPKPKPKK